MKTVLRLLAAVLAAGGLASALFVSGACNRREFRLSGTVTLTSSLVPRAPKDHSVLFVIVRNRGGVPVAIKRIVNPHFPVRFSFEPADLLVPELRDTRGLLVDAQMNTHGNVGAPRPGDLLGEHPDPVKPGERNVHIVLERLAP